MAKHQTSENGLVEKEVNSSCSAVMELASEKLQELNQLTQTIFGNDPDMGVFYLDYGIRLGKWREGAFHFYQNEVLDPNFVQLARIFNQQRELKIWRGPEGYCYRLRDDTSGDLCHVIEARQYLWGTQAEALGEDCTRLYEERGTEVIVPFRVQSDPGVSQPLAYVHTRNYIGYLGNGQATYVDCRFVAVARRA